MSFLLGPTTPAQESALFVYSAVRREDESFIHFYLQSYIDYLNSGIAYSFGVRIRSLVVARRRVAV